MITSGSTTGAVLIRDEIWSKTIQEELLQELFATDLVFWISGEFSDGDLITLPTLGSMTTRTYTENSDITIDDPGAGEFQLIIDKYNQAGIGITDKMKQDTYYMNILTQKFPEQAVRALMEKLEADTFELHKQQTDNDANEINGHAHRFVASGTSNAVTLADVAKAKLALDKANVPKNGRFAIIDPVVSNQLVNIDNVIRQDVYGSNANLREGFGGTKFIGTYLGFDFFESNTLDTATALDYTTGGSLVANLFCGIECFIGAIREMPEIEFSRDWARKRDIYHATMRYGMGLYRPESLVTLLSGQTAVS